MDRPFAPTPRRRALARAAGVVLESPAWTAALAVAAGALALAATAAGVAAQLRASTHAAFIHAADGDVVARATATDTAGLAARILAATAPLVVACAAGALAAGAALARGLFVPRRPVRGAPSAPDAPVTDALLGVARGATIAAVGVSFVLDRLGAFSAAATVSATGDAAAPAGLAVSALAHAAAAAAVLAALDVVVRHRRLAAALRMTAREARDDARQAGADPHARRRLRDARAHDPRDHLRDASVLLVGADVVVALRRTAAAPEILVTGRGLAGRQLVAAARHRAIPALADDALASALAGHHTVPAAHLSAVAHTLAAI